MCSLSFGIYKVRADISWVTLSGHRAAPPWNQSPLRTFSWPLIELHKLCKPLISRAFWGHTWDRSHPGTKCFCETLQIAMQEASMEMGEVGQALGGYTGSSPHTENTSKKTVHMLWRSSFPPKPHLTSGVFMEAQMSKLEGIPENTQYKPSVMQRHKPKKSGERCGLARVCWVPALLKVVCAGFICSYCYSSKIC